MAKSVSEWSDQIRSALSSIDSTISTEVGDPVRKIIDAAASVAAGIDLNSEVNKSFFDIDSKTGTDLDAIASWLGFGRRAGIASSGEVRFYVNDPAVATIDIPSGTQVTDGNVIFETLTSAAIAQYDTETTVRVQCTTVGVAGNVNAYEISQVMTTIASVELNVENQYNTENGVDTETDEELRTRIKQTFLRNVAGTEDAYRGVSDKVIGTNRVNVVGPVERWEEQLEVEPLTTSQGGGYGFQSMIPCSKYTWDRQTYLVKEPGTENEKVYTEGVDYNIDPTRGNPIVKINMNANELNIDALYGSQLDSIGKSLGLPRFAGEAARARASFGFDIAQKSNYTIAAGSEIKDADGNLWKTKTDAIIYSGGFASSLVNVESEDMKPIAVTDGEQATLVDRTGFNVLMSKAAGETAATTGQSAWDDSTYRANLKTAFQEKISISVGDFLFFKHEYCAIDSRNDPAATPPIVNKVDVFIDGINAQTISEVSQINHVTLNNDNASMWYCGNFYYEDGTTAVNGTKIEVLGYSPVLTIPDSININGALYQKNVHYRLIKNQTMTKGSVREIDALAWIPGASIPDDGSFTQYDYTYNKAVVVTDELLDINRQITTDVLCHEAKSIGLVINLVVQNTLGASDDSVLSSINGLLDSWAASMDFGQWIQFSDIEQVVRNAVGVDACRIATANDTSRIVTSGDNVGKTLKSGLQTVEKYKSFLSKQHDDDFRLWESMIPTIYQVNIARASSNTFA